MAETSGNGGSLRLSYGVALTPAAAASGGRQEPRALELVAQCGVVPVLVRTHAFEEEDQQRVRVFVGNLSSVSGSTLADFALHGAAILRHGWGGEWRECMGVEPTCPPNDGHTGFEDRFHTWNDSHRQEYPAGSVPEFGPIVAGVGIPKRCLE